MTLFTRAFAAMLVLLGTATASWAFSAGNEFLVNKTTAGKQDFPVVAALTGGGFVAVWESENTEGEGFSIVGQRYNKNGNPVGKTEFKVNKTTTVPFQRAPNVAGLADGGFVVVWTSNVSGSWVVYGQRYNKRGKRVGASEFQVTKPKANGQQSPNVAGLADGGFVVVWDSLGQDFEMTLGVYGQRYNAGGKAVGKKGFRINKTKEEHQRNPIVAGLAKGGFVVVWYSLLQDGEGNGVYAQRYNSVGKTVGTREFLVNKTTAGGQQGGRVAGLANGGFVIAWQSVSFESGSTWDSFGQRYNKKGKHAGKREFRVNKTKANNQSNPSVTALADGGFAIAWTSFEQDGDSGGVYGQRYSKKGKHVGQREFPVNTQTGGLQQLPSVAGLADGGLAAVWQSQNQDGDDFGVYGKHYTP